MEMIQVYLLFALGIVLIVKGGDWFVEGAAWVAKATGIPNFIVGATIVSMATTLPEITVSVIAALEGRELRLSGIGDHLNAAGEKVGMAIGNGVGSVICNTALVMSVSILFRPGAVERCSFVPKAVLMLLAVGTLQLCAGSGALNVFGAGALLLIFALFIYENIRSAQGRMEQQVTAEIPDKQTVIRHMIYILAGAAAIVTGSRLLVDYGSRMARGWGVSEDIIGVTMVAVGTSLPELVTAITAVVKKETAMSLGNVMGANIIDITLILAICTFVYGGALPVSVQNVYLDFPVAMLVSLLAAVPVIVTGKTQKWQGICMIGLYMVYLWLRIG